MSAKFIVAVAFVIERNGEILMLRRSTDKDHAPGAWETGSGRVEYGEGAEAAVRREVLEETGLEVEIMAPVATFHFYRGAAREEAIGITFWCRYVAGELVTSAEHDLARWVSPIEAGSLVGSPGESAAIALVAKLVHGAP